MLLETVPGSPIHLAYRRCGLILPPFPTHPDEMDLEQWKVQGHEVREVLGAVRCERDGRWYARMAWEDSWEDLGQLAEETLEKFQRWRQSQDDNTPYVSLAAEQRASKTYTARQRLMRGRSTQAASSARVTRSASAGAAPTHTTA